MRPTRWIAGRPPSIPTGPDANVDAPASATTSPAKGAWTSSSAAARSSTRSTINLERRSQRSGLDCQLGQTSQFQFFRLPPPGGEGWEGGSLASGSSTGTSSPLPNPPPQGEGTRRNRRAEPRQVGSVSARSNSPSQPSINEPALLIQPRRKLWFRVGIRPREEIKTLGRRTSK